ncbi:phage terminase large subunit [Actinotalea sp. M2MS4P-6]|uniref:phage terminase large subunit n=1 Tax=Actinotalea sp. M2MS4P-6 TaxID=2983762 RepID=UPI0021E38054|nr:phage terminase large subunit [Actinotalea sp. M2MS4P-6]MCV2395936.1 phage terminase large subunit [Actinotalea sp. M2MS4P-6]
MTVAWAEHAARQFEPARPPRWATPADMAADLDPRFRRTPAIDHIDAAITETLNTLDGRLIVSMPPQEGKSTLATKWTPVHRLVDHPDDRIVVASYALSPARRMGRLIRGEINAHSAELGLRIADDVGAQAEFELAGHEGGIYAVGIGGGLTSRPADVLIIDDPLKDREEADSEVYRERAWEWWTDTASARLAPGAPVILILTRWHHDDLAGRLLAAEDGGAWRVVNIPAQADHRPEAGQTDPLGREPGEFMISARTFLDRSTGQRVPRTRAQWERRKTQAGPRTWASLYQGRPTPDTGDLFPAEWARYDHELWVERADGSRIITHRAFELVQSWDLAFKDRKSSDYVVGQVWLRIGAEAFLVDQVRDRLSFTKTLAAIKAMSARWPQATAKFVEDKANGPAVINALHRTIGGLIPIEPEGSKYARAAAVSPLCHSGNVVLPEAELLPNVEDLITEAAAFPNGAHDDAVDALSQAINRILLMPLLDEDDAWVTGDDLIDDDDPHAIVGGY